MNSARFPQWILPIVITVLALADGVLHFALDVVIFRGNFFGRLGPPPGAVPAAAPPGPPPGPLIPLPLPLNQLFLLNLLGYVVVVALFWLVLQRFPRWRRWIDGVLILYVAIVFLGWVDVGAPNPMGYLGYLSKGIEILLVVALLVHLRILSRTASSQAAHESTDRAVLAR